MPVPAPIRGSERIKVHYRVARDDADTFFVEISYDDVVSLFPCGRRRGGKGVGAREIGQAGRRSVPAEKVAERRAVLVEVAGA